MFGLTVKPRPSFSGNSVQGTLLCSKLVCEINPVWIGGKMYDNLGNSVAPAVAADAKRIEVAKDQMEIRTGYPY